MIRKVNDDFEDLVLKNTKITLVDFYAEWCGPCKKQVPILESLSKDDWFDVVSLDVDENGEVAFKYDIQSIPTLIVFKDGEIVRRLIGLKSEKEILEALEEAK